MHRIRWKLAALCLPLLLWAQGNVQATLTQLGQTSVYVLQFNWTGDSGGNVPVTSAGNLSAVQGYEITAVECVPGTPNPSNGYSVKVLDAAGVDVLAGAANSVSGSQAQTFAAAAATPNIQGALRLQITGNTVNGGQGAVYVFVQKPGTVSARKLKSVSGVGSTVTPDWLTLANSPFADARRYNFPPQAPGGSLIAGSNTVTLTPVPAGVNGSDTGHYLYVSGGTGTAEACQITGGGAVGGTPTGSVTLQCANTHSGAFTVASSSGGIQEAVCSLPIAGGSVGVPISLTLYANVGACGKSALMIAKSAGVTLTGSFTVLGASNLGSQAQHFANPGIQYNITGPNWSTLPGGTWAAQRSAINNFPLNGEFQGTATPTVAALDGAVDSAFTSNGAAIGVMGTARGNWTSPGGGTAAVGVFGIGYQGVPATGSNVSWSWGANFAAMNCPITNCADGQGSQNSQSYGIEIDVSVYKDASGNSATNAWGLWITGSASHTPTGTADAVGVGPIGNTAGVNDKPWRNAFHTNNGSAMVGILLGTAQTNGASDGQPFQLTARSAGGTTYTSVILADQTGNLIQRSGLGQIVFEDASGNIGAEMIPSGSTPYFGINNNLTMGNNATVVVPRIKATSGTRYVCVDTLGQILSSATACSGT